MNTREWKPAACLHREEASVQRTFAWQLGMATTGLGLAALLSLAGPVGARLGPADSAVGTATPPPCVSVATSTASRIRPTRQPAQGRLPLGFEANQGQADGRVRFLSRGPGYVLYLTPAEAVVALSSAAMNAGGDAEGARRLVLRMLPLGGNPAPEVEGLDKLAGKSHYLLGNDPTQWQRDIPHYARVRYRQIYPGIDLVYHRERGRLEYDFVVGPGADPGAIRLRLAGADEMALDGHGNLVLRAAGGQVVQQAPRIYQEIDGEVREVAGGYVSLGQREIGFQLADYDRDETLVIDPILVYSTYLGGTTGARATFPGSSVDAATDVALDPWGYLYVTGRTNAIDFPVTPGAVQESYTLPAAGQEEAFVVKLDPAAADGLGSDLIWATYLGGSGREFGLGIAVDGFGEAYVTGMTESFDFPTVNPFQAAHLGGGTDVFVAKLSGAGSSLVYSTYLGSPGGEWGLGIAVDAAGQAHVTGMTSASGGGAPDFPVTPGAFDESFNGNIDAFVTKLSADGTTLLYSTYFGGVGGVPFSTSVDQGKDIAVDAAGHIYLVGSTRPLLGESIPTTAGAFQPAFGGGLYDLFVSQLDPAGGGASDLVYSTYLGGSGDDGEVGVLQNGWFGNGTALAIDDLGRIYVTASTLSADFPTVNAFQPAIGGATDRDAFVAVLDPAAADGLGSDLVYSTYLGGGSEEVGYGIAVDGAGLVHVAGVAHSADFPTVDPLQPAVQSVDAFVARIDPSQAGAASLVFSTYLGGFSVDRAFAVAADAAGSTTVVGQTSSGDNPTTPPDEAFPTTAGALREELGGSFSGFVAQIGPAANQAPLAENDAYALDEDLTLSVAAPGVLANDSDGDGDALTALLLVGPDHGGLSLQADGSFDYAPDADFNGSDGFTYVASDGEDDSNVATVTFTVHPVNDLPVAVDDNGLTSANAAVVIDLLANDSDADGDILTVSAVSDPPNGATVDNGDGTVTYLPDAGFSGSDSFTYTINDGQGGVATATVYVDVVAVTFVVTIDIKPGAFPNSINLGSNGVIPVAILSTPTFDATTVDPTTVFLADAEVRVRGNGTPQAQSQDVDGDGLLDLVLHVETEGLELSETDTVAVLIAETFDGTPVTGEDTIRVVPP